MHLKVFVKLKNTLKTPSSGQNNPKKPKKNPKNPKKNQKTQKNPLGWVFLKKPGFFPTLKKTHYQCCGSGMFIPDLDFYHSGSRIPDLGSRIKQQHQKRRGQKVFCPTLFLATNIIKL
jgi:hypothetical protein